MSRDGFVFYRSFYEATEPLSPEQKIEMFDAICQYGLNQEELNLSPIPKAMFRLIKPQLEANHRKYLAGVKNGKKGAEHGIKGGRPRKSEKPLNNPQETPKKPSNVNVNEKVKEKVNVLERRNYRFSPPSIQELEDYFFLKTQNKDYSKIHAEKFFYHYDSKNWMIGNNKMKKWKSSVSGWISRQKDFEKEKSSDKKENLSASDKLRLALTKTQNGGHGK